MKLDNKGFAVSTIIYSVLILFLVLVFGVLSVLGTRKVVLDKLKKDVMNKLNEDIIVKEYKDESGANTPLLLDKMVPIKYDGINWIYADTNEKWYDYNNKEWANAVILKSNVVKSIGQTISEDDIALWYVWIPRYKYTIFNGNNEVREMQEINILFEQGIGKTGTVSCNDAIGQTDNDGNFISEICTDIDGSVTNGVSTYTHPAFTLGDAELTGIWVGKFENSTTDEACLINPNDTNCKKNTHIIEIKPNTNSLRFASVANQYHSIASIATNYNLNNVDSHMMKNIEWGAVAYLTNSKYGRCKDGVCEEVTINNVRKDAVTLDTQTGCAGSSFSISTTCENEYDTIGGVKASTTGNIYGIYDMSGGALEYVMGNMVNQSGNFFQNDALFSEVPNNKYYDIYTYSTLSNEQQRGKLGDATKEVLSILGNVDGAWNKDKSNFPNSSSPWIQRGGSYDDGESSGIFYFNSSAGGSYNTHTSRSVIVSM